VNTAALALTPDQVEQYRTLGFLVVNDVLAPEQIAEGRRLVNHFTERSRTVAASDDVFDLEPGHTPERPMLRRLKGPARLHPFFDRLLRSEPLLDCLETLIGQPLRLLGSKLNLKAAAGGSPVEWHQDFAFHPHTNADVLALGVYLDDAALDNGCMLMVPGSHHGPVLDHHQDGVFVGAITPGRHEVDLSRAVPVEVRAGGISIHHGHMLHASAPNRSARGRRLLLYDLAGIDAWPLMGVTDLAAYQRQALRGTPPTTIRVTSVSARIPLPLPAQAGSIFEMQTRVRDKTFVADM
jgi:ectoine hydroxylase-related dioxygenase (phytanoyl-CoA dioxygenase family)